MKKFLSVLAMVILFPVISLANPFLGCDAYDASVGVLYFTGTFDGTNFQTNYSLYTPNPLYAIVYDFAGVDMKIPHTFGNIKACNAAGCSDPGISFVTPVIPAAPANLRFIP